MLRAYVATYGDNLKKYRGERTQEEIARIMGKPRQANLPQYENNRKRPTPRIVEQHAKALGVKPWQLLEGVELPYDKQREGDEAFALSLRFRRLQPKGQEIIRQAFARAERYFAGPRVSHEGIARKPRQKVLHKRAHVTGQ